MNTWYRRRGKRWLDLAIAVPAAVLAAPVLLVVAVIVRLALGCPILFRHPRPGLQGRPFTLLKFRTMSDARDARGQLLPDAQRLGRIGRVLRSLSVDELPELWNVLRGEMSLVGPRPLLPQYMERYNAEQRRRHDVLPGLTGWAQLHGRNAVSWERRFELDVWYVDHISLPLDLRILVGTVWEVVRRRGISEPGHATAREFMGGSVVRVLLIGAGGHAQVIADALRLAPEVQLVGCLDQHVEARGATLLGAPVYGAGTTRSEIPHDAVIVAIGDNGVRRKVFEELRAQGARFAIARHPSAIIASDVTVGAGSMICAGVIVNSGATIGENTIINSGAVVEHHVCVGDHAHIAPGARLGGAASIGAGSMVGIGATVLPRVQIGAGATVGGGALVKDDVADELTVVGVPAKPTAKTAKSL